MREAFDSEVRTSRKPRLILSAATAAGKNTTDSAYDIPVMVKYVSISKCMLVANFSYTYNKYCVFGRFICIQLHNFHAIENSHLYYST